MSSDGQGSIALRVLRRPDVLSCVARASGNPLLPLVAAVDLALPEAAIEHLSTTATESLVFPTWSPWHASRWARWVVDGATLREIAVSVFRWGCFVDWGVGEIEKRGLREHPSKLSLMRDLLASPVSLRARMLLLGGMSFWDCEHMSRWAVDPRVVLLSDVFQSLEASASQTHEDIRRRIEEAIEREDLHRDQKRLPFLLLAQRDTRCFTLLLAAAEVSLFTGDVRIAEKAVAAFEPAANRAFIARSRLSASLLLAGANEAAQRVLLRSLRERSTSEDLLCAASPTAMAMALTGTGGGFAAALRDVLEDAHCSAQFVWGMLFKAMLTGGEAGKRMWERLPPECAVEGNLSCLACPVGFLYESGDVSELLAALEPHKALGVCKEVIEDGPLEEAARWSAASAWEAVRTEALCAGRVDTLDLLLGTPFSRGDGTVDVSGNALLKVSARGLWRSLRWLEENAEPNLFGTHRLFSDKGSDFQTCLAEHVWRLNREHRELCAFVISRGRWSAGKDGDAKWKCAVLNAIHICFLDEDMASCIHIFRGLPTLDWDGFWPPFRRGKGRESFSKFDRGPMLVARDAGLPSLDVLSSVQAKVVAMYTIWALNRVARLETDTDAGGLESPGFGQLQSEWKGHAWFATWKCGGVHTSRLSEALRSFAWDDSAPWQFGEGVRFAFECLSDRWRLRPGVKAALDAAVDAQEKAESAFRSGADEKRRKPVGVVVARPGPHEGRAQPRRGRWREEEDELRALVAHRRPSDADVALDPAACAAMQPLELVLATRRVLAGAPKSRGGPLPAATGDCA